MWIIQTPRSSLTWAGKLAVSENGPNVLFDGDFRGLDAAGEKFDEIVHEAQARGFKLISLMGAWRDAVRASFYRPLKQAVSTRLDADVVAWLKKTGKGYQTRANQILRQRMLDDSR
jgi:uncharacterized protein (DUF4415 family)